MTYFLALFVRHLGEDFEVGDISQNDVDAYVNARRSGTLRPERGRAKDAPADGTIRNELNGLSTACNWATRGGRKRLLSLNPIRGLKLPVEKNRARPRATKERYEALLAVSGKADPQGRLEVLLVLAWETGRRINALLHLRASDILLSPDAISRAFAEEGKPEEEGQAEAWQHAIRWRAEWDKMGYLGFSPLNQAARSALTAYLHKRPVVGEGFVFPGNGDPSEALNKQSAGYYLRKAEKLAGLTPQKQGGWHAFRRAWATRRKGLPVQDVMAAGGWRDVKALQDAYQGSDPMTTRKVMELS